ncbi:DUF4019 domain-containing protein [uncultured Desulfuromonas sp.]|uniref:DUF4019 domain-containing protein n=1 Tax=uncultured Desulfuromonas sp. TaxID=181013 RepID=UPI002AAB5888|nr:DUF4019 domain-containing protein [uncultured Desulfuromonas sp.]
MISLCEAGAVLNVNNEKLPLSFDRVHFYQGHGSRLLCLVFFIQDILFSDGFLLHFSRWKSLDFDRLLLKQNVRDLTKTSKIDKKGALLKVFSVIAAVVIMLVAPHVLFANQSQEAAAISSAESFLQLVDSGHYGESWEATSKLFKAQVSKQQWIAQLEQMHPLFGALVKREIKGRNYTKSLPGAPDGDYVVIQFTTEFENKKNSLETITPMLENDGKWRVSGYYVR